MKQGHICMRGFEGRWSILREIADRKNGTIGRLAGQAVFRKIPERKGALFYEPAFPRWMPVSSPAEA